MITFKSEKLPSLINCHDYYLGKLRGWVMGGFKENWEGRLKKAFAVN